MRKGNIRKKMFLQTFGLAYSRLNSAKLSCLSEVTLTLSENMGKGNISICGYVPLISCQKSLTALPFIRQVRLFPTRYPTSLTNDLCSSRISSVRLWSFSFQSVGHDQLNFWPKSFGQTEPESDFQSPFSTSRIIRIYFSH